MLARLRSATREAHQQLETQLDVVNRLRCGPERQRLIVGYQTLYSGAAKLLNSWVDSGGSCPGSIAADALPRVDIHSRAEALGFRYVIEGSTLGGRVILRQLEALGIDTTGLGFLDPHGSRTGEVWRSFVAVLEGELTALPGALDEAVSGAVKGFAYARACLGQGLPAA